jgi:hypothetical protein
MVHVAAAEERHAIQNILLAPFKSEIDHRRNIESDELGNDQSPDDYQSKGPSRRPSAP